jgi:methionyl aminopeptidase
MAQIELKSPRQLATMREAGRLLAGVLSQVAAMAKPGVTTGELDRAAEELMAAQGAVAAFKGYRGFPASICTSVNEEVVHGIPGPRELAEGDLLKVDAGVVWQGYYSDAAVSVPIGRIGEEARRLMDATRKALQAGMAVVRAGVTISRIAAAIQAVAEGEGFSVVTEYTGHGIGRSLHEEPRVPNFVAPRMLFQDAVLDKGATIAIEPMVNAGTERTEVLGNGWTVVTKDRRLSAHFEHTVAVDATGPVILTLP